MFSVKYKFLAWKDEEIKTVNFDGASISVAEMRTAVALQTHCDPLDLVFKDHATDDQFPDEGSIPRNSYVIVYRVIAKRTSSGAPVRAPRRHLPNVPPPENYVCDRCRGTGHYKANCPTIDNPAYDAGFATPAGIPTSMTISATLESGTIRLANGTIAALKTHHETLDAVAQQRKLKEEAFESIPEQMRCSISRDLLKDPHTVPCCKSNFCAKCILPDSIHDAVQCPNCYKNVVGDKIVANPTLAKEIDAWKISSGFKENVDSAASSSSNLPSIAAAAPTVVTKVERRKPPPRRGAQPAATPEPTPPPSDAPSTAPVPEAPTVVITTTATQTSKLEEKHGNAKEIEKSPIESYRNLQPQASSPSLPAQFEAKSTAGTVSTQPPTSGPSHNSVTSVAPSSTNSHASKPAPSLSNSASTGTAPDIKDKSPQSRLKEIAALREAKRKAAESSSASSAPAPTTGSLAATSSTPKSGNVSPAHVSSSSAMDVTTEPQDARRSRDRDSTEHARRGNDEERYSGREENDRRDRRGRNDHRDERGRGQDDRDSRYGDDHHESIARRDKDRSYDKKSRDDRRGNDRRDDRRDERREESRDADSERFGRSGREFRGNGSRKYDSSRGGGSSGSGGGSSSSSNGGGGHKSGDYQRKRSHDEYSRSSSHGYGERDRDGYGKSRKQSERDTVHSHRRDDAAESSARENLQASGDGRARSPDIHH